MTIEEAIKILDPETTREALSACCDKGEMNRLVDEACETVCAAFRDQQWIRVEDKLPEKNVSVLVCASHWIRCMIAEYDGGGVWMDDRCRAMTYTPIHWMPLPEQPEEVQK